MRGEAKRKNRAARLRLLNQSVTFEKIADLANVNASYLSQIANEALQTSSKTLRKSPRGLSDNYAEKIENALNLEPGWFDIPANHDNVIRESVGTYDEAELNQEAVEFAMEFMTALPKDILKVRGKDWMAEIFRKAYTAKLDTPEISVMALRRIINL